MIKKAILSLLLAVSVIGTMSVGASAEWKQDKYNNWSFKENGVEVQGWKQIDGLWYYFGTDGKMQKGWMKDNGNWYYLWSSGSMAYNCWLWNGGLWYYFDANGKLVSSSVVVENRQYNFEKPAFIYSEDLNGNKITIDPSTKVKNTETTGASVTVENTSTTSAAVTVSIK